MLEYKEVTLILGGLLSVNILGALVYRPQDKKADKRIAEDNSEKTDEKMAEDNSVESHSSMKKSIKNGCESCSCSILLEHYSVEC